MISNKIITTNLPIFYTGIEKLQFYKYLNILEFIEKSEELDSSLIITINSEFINKEDFIYLKSLFLRYNLDTKTLEIFKDHETKTQFKKELKLENISDKSGFLTLIIKPLFFDSSEDRDMLFDWLYSLSCVMKVKGVLNHINVAIKSKEISKEDYDNLKAIFERYKFQNIEQLDVFIDKDTKKPFNN